MERLRNRHLLGFHFRDVAVAIYDIGEGNDTAFIPMEYLEGKALKHLISGRPMELEQLLQLVIEIAERAGADLGCFDKTGPQQRHRHIGEIRVEQSAG